MNATTSSGLPCPISFRTPPPQQRTGNTDTRASVAYVSQVTDAKWRGERLVLEHLRRRVVAGGYGDDAVSAATLAAVSCAVLPRVTCDGALVAYGDAHVQASRWKVHEEPRTLWASPEAWLWQRDYETSPSGQIRTRPCQDGTQPKAHELPCYATVMP